MKSFLVFWIFSRGHYTKKGRTLLFLLQTPIKSRFITIKQGSNLTLPFALSILVICQELFKKDFEMFRLKMGALNRRMEKCSHSKH